MVPAPRPDGLDAGVEVVAVGGVEVLGGVAVVGGAEVLGGVGGGGGEDAVGGVAVVGGAEVVGGVDVVAPGGAHACTLFICNVIGEAPAAWYVQRPI